VFCGSHFCVDLDKHLRFEARIQAAGGEPGNYLLISDPDRTGMYHDWDAEFSGTDHPALYLEKCFAEMLKDEFGGASAARA
jgi:hypothetical protein